MEKQFPWLNRPGRTIRPSGRNGPRGRGGGARLGRLSLVAPRRISAVRSDRTVTRVSRANKKGPSHGAPETLAHFFPCSPLSSAAAFSAATSRPTATRSREEARAWRRRRGTPRRHACSPAAEHAVVERPCGRCPETHHAQ